MSKIPSSVRDSRTLDRRRAQFELERRLHAELLATPKASRAAATEAAYDELFRQFHDHQMFQIDEDELEHQGRRKAAMFLPLTRRGASVLEIGCGQGHVIKAMQDEGRAVVGLDPSHTLVEIARQRGVDARVGIADRLDFGSATFDLVFSQQVLEHLHPDDVPSHLAEVHRVLKPGGVVAIETPNRRTGPQDISRGFSKRAEGLHLKEWGIGELARALRNAGFMRLRGLLAPPVLARRSPLLHRLRVPVWIKSMEDVALAAVPHLEARTTIARALGVDDVFLIAWKP